MACHSQFPTSLGGEGICKQPASNSPEADFIACLGGMTGDESEESVDEESDSALVLEDDGEPEEVISGKAAQLLGRSMSLEDIPESLLQQLKSVTAPSSADLSSIRFPTASLMPRDSGSSPASGPFGGPATGPPNEVSRRDVLGHDGVDTISKESSGDKLAIGHTLFKKKMKTILKPFCKSLKIASNGQKLLPRNIPESFKTVSRYLTFNCNGKRHNRDNLKCTCPCTFGLKYEYHYLNESDSHLPLFTKVQNSYEKCDECSSGREKNDRTQMHNCEEGQDDLPREEKKLTPLPQSYFMLGAKLKSLGWAWKSISQVLVSWFFFDDTLERKQDYNLQDKILRNHVDAINEKNLTSVTEVQDYLRDECKAGRIAFYRIQWGNEPRTKKRKQALDAAKDPKQKCIRRVFWVTTAQLWSWKSLNFDVVSFDFSFNLTMYRNLAFGSFMTRNPCSPNRPQQKSLNTLLSLANFFVEKESKIDVDFVVDSVHKFTDEFGIEAPAKQKSAGDPRKLPFEVLIHDGASAHTVLFPEISNSSSIADLLETYLKLKDNIDQRGHHFFSHSLMNCRCIAPTHLPSNWISNLHDKCGSTLVLRNLINEFWQLVLETDVNEWESLDDRFARLVQKYCKIDGYEVPEKLRFFDKNMREIKQQITESLDADWSNKGNILENIIHFDDAISDILNDLVSESLSRSVADAAFDDAKVRKIAATFQEFINFHSDKVDTLTTKILKQISKDITAFNKSVPSVSSPHTKRGKSDSSVPETKSAQKTNGLENQLLCQELEKMYSMKHLFFWAIVNSGFNCNMHASSWSESLHSSLKRTIPNLRYKSLVESMKSIDAYSNTKYADAMTEIKKQNQEAGMHPELSNVIRLFAADATVKAKASSDLYQVQNETAHVKDSPNFSYVHPSNISEQYLNRVKLLCQKYNISTKDIVFLRCTRKERHDEGSESASDTLDLNILAHKLRHAKGRSRARGRVVACYLHCSNPDGSNEVPKFLGKIEQAALRQYLPIFCSCQNQVASGIPCVHMLCSLVAGRNPTDTKLLPCVPIWLYNKKYIKASQSGESEPGCAIFAREHYIASRYKKGLAVNVIETENGKLFEGGCTWKVCKLQQKFITEVGHDTITVSCMDGSQKQVLSLREADKLLQVASVDFSRL